MAQEHADLDSAPTVIDGAGGKVMDAELPDRCLEDWPLERPPSVCRAGDVQDRDVNHGVDHAEYHRRRNRAQVEALRLALETRHGNVEPWGSPAADLLR
ncbi:hypothetical protein QR90_08345 [Deinococcus radiopugnans]|uniref:Uncharacterized protein n=1 Tax=Deinococcus radiopugnans TaxID=57497 RepID=A0A0A7KIP3_9DEIO|nr:hypothetical protein QR90_08345 [Deinococcus radiopugnans]